MKPLVTIIVPVYNVEDYVGRCLESLRMQNYDNIEILIVDDGSTDNSGEICDEFVKSEKRGKVFHKKNGGLSDARNFGIEKAKGDLIALVDSDDYVEKDFISKMYKAMKNNKADIAVCGYDDQLPKAGLLSGEDAVVRLLIRQENTDIVAWNKLYKKKLFCDILYPIGMKHEDTLTTYKILSKADKVIYVPEALYHYEKRSGSIMNSEKTEDRLLIRERAANEAVCFFAESEDLKEAAEVSLLLAKYAYVDAAVRKEIGLKYYNDGVEWIKNNKKNFDNNKYMTWKLKLYNVLVEFGLYRGFRKIV